MPDAATARKYVEDAQLGKHVQDGINAAIRSQADDPVKYLSDFLANVANKPSPQKVVLCPCPLENLRRYNAGAFLMANGGPAGKDSVLYAPSSTAQGPLPAVVVVHGMCAETRETAEQFQEMIGVTTRFNWQCMDPLARQLASQGFAVLMIGAHDGDEQLYNAADNEMNAFAAVDYSKILRAAVDHLFATAPRLGVPIDPKRIGLMGHSLGAAGVLYAAAEHCRDSISAVVAVNPAHISIEKPHDRMAECQKFLTGPDHSGEFGEGTLDYLPKIIAPTLVYGTQAEYNTEQMPGQGYCDAWPFYPSILEQVGAAKKEMYVDDMKELSNLSAHIWFMTKKSGEDCTSYANGAPLDVICSFLRRHLAGSDEPVPEKPKRCKEWTVVFDE